ncbi:MAG: RNA chaperone Hfq [Acidobacteriota bacterium]|nr:MAG: RNA chaperone Hfq [Acidobacteriota bacterium]
MVNRKLIRPSLSDLREQEQAKYTRNQKKKVPPEQTNAEEYYYLKQMANKTPMVVLLVDGEEIQGIIEWYDKNCIKVNREEKPNLLILKSSIKYMYKLNEVKELNQPEVGFFPSERGN